MTDTVNTSNSAALDMRPHVLVIDNDRHVCGIMERLLRRQGYRVSVASTLSAARDLAAKERPHLALVDVRLRDNNDLYDTSGLDLAKELNPAIVKIILTAYPDVDMATDALTPLMGGKSLAVGFISKSDAPKESLPMIREAIEQHVQINFDLQISWEDGLTAGDYVRVVDAGQADDFVRADLIDALRRLFRKADAIQVYPLAQDPKTYLSSPSGAVLLRVVPTHDGVKAASRAVKIAVWNKIEREIKNYDEFVNVFAGFRAARIQQHARMHCLGGIEYIFVGAVRGNLDDFVSLYRYYKTHNVDAIKLVLRDLFDNVYELWRGAIRDPQQYDLCQLYFDPLKVNKAKLHQAMQSLFEHTGAIDDWNKEPLCLPDLRSDLPNPFLWLERWLADTENVTVQTRLSITHGDLHSENVLIHENRCWLIDFYRTGWGHYLRDIIELETDIKFALLLKIDLPQLLAFEARLLSPEFFTRGEEWAAGLGDPGLDKAYRVLYFLRSKAAELGDGELDLHEYLHALLYQTLNILRLKTIGAPQKTHALLSAALICKRLETWDQPWPVPRQDE
jgi:CheY-like chemotaxis protein